MSTAETIDEIEEEAVQLGGKPRGDDEIDMTPMIDITFLLLIFFVVTSDMNPEKAADLPEARNGMVIALNNAAVIQVRPGPGERPEVIIGDGRKLSDDPDAQDVEIADFLKFETDQGRTLVVLQGDGDCTTGQFGAIRRSVSQALEEIEVLHVAIMEKP